MKQSAFIILAIILSLNLNAQTGEKITFEDIFQKGTFRAESVKGLRSMKDGENYTTLENGTRVVKNSYETGEEVETLFDITKIEDAPISSFSNYEFSEDETKILLTTDIDRIYRHSYTAQYYVWNSVTEDFIPLSENGPQQLATFSPDGDRVAFVRENNLFIKNLKFGNETQITHDGEKNKIIKV